MSAQRPLECLIVGAPGAGKTLLALSLIEALGYRDVRIYHEDPKGKVTSRSWPIAEAKQALVAREGNHGTTTRGLQWATVELPAGFGRGKRSLTLVDSAGLGAGIENDAALRAAEAQTLRLLRRATMVIHLISPAEGGPGTLDEVLRGYCGDLPQGRYLQLASKADLSHGGRTIGQSAAAFRDALPVSALRRKDLGRVLQRLRRSLSERPPAV